MLVVLATGALCKGVSKFLMRTSVTNLDSLLAALPSKPKERDRVPRGLLTISNHISTMDEPMWNTVLPWSLYTDKARYRWILGAKDVMFTNRLFRWYFASGRVLETDRHGPGIYQWSVDQAIEILKRGGWVHIFPEGYVNQPRDYENRQYELLRFKWGVSRILLEAPRDITILPIYLKGFDQIMPEGRAFPWKYLPRLRQSISVNFAREPLDRRKEIDPLLMDTALLEEGRCVSTPIQGQGPFYKGESSQLRNVRIRIADTLRQAMLRLKDQVEGTSA